MKIRLSLILGDTFAFAKNPKIFVQRIRMLKHNFEKQSISWHLINHKRTCADPVCFCGGVSEQRLIHSDLPAEEETRLKNEFLNKLFATAFEGHTRSPEEKSFLLQHYAEFLIDCQQFPKAIALMFHIAHEGMSFFNRSDNFRVKQKIAREYRKAVYFDGLEKKMKCIEEYDSKVGFVVKEIREILRNKVVFWAEMCKEAPLLKQLEVDGRSLIQRIEKLHEYFVFEVKPTEEVLSSFKCTFIYASYLILTTNYLEFANSLTKKSQKMFEEKKGNVGTQQEFGLFLQISENKEKIVSHLFELTITNISKSLCTLLHMEKEELLNCNLVDIIPVEYRKSHTDAFDRYIKNVSFRNTKSPLFMPGIELPFRVDREHVVFLKVDSALRFDPVNNVTCIQSLLRRNSDDSIKFVIDLDGQLVYKETDSFQDFATCTAVKDTIAALKKEFTEKGAVGPTETKMEDEDHIFYISFSPLYHDEETRQLIKVTAKSDYFKSEKHRLENFDPTQRMKKIRNATISHQEEDSQASSSSRKDSIENVLTVLTESNSLRVEPFLTLTLFLMSAVALAWMFLVKDFFNIWSAEKY